jgi:hypothetical protein
MLTTHTNRGAISTTLPAALPHTRSRRVSASVVRLVIQATIAGAVGVFMIRTGWPMPFEPTFVLGIAFVLWLVANFAAEPAPTGTLR